MFRKNSPYFFLSACVAASAFFFTSCGGGDNAENAELTDVEVTTDTISSEVRINFDLIRVNIPKPSDLSQKLTAAKIPYNKNLLLSSGHLMKAYEGDADADGITDLIIENDGIERDRYGNSDRIDS